MMHHKCIDENIFPLTGKGIKKPSIFKKEERGDSGNYRPVSVTSVPIKITEAVLLETILRYMENNGMIGDSHHSFTKGK